MDECDLDSPTVCVDESSEDEESESSDATESVDSTTDDGSESEDEESEDGSSDQTYYTFETGSEDFDCESGIPLYEASVEILEHCVGKPCEKGRRVLLNRDENQIEKEIIQILLCQDGTWTIEDYFDSGGAFTESGSESKPKPKPRRRQSA